MAIASLKSNDCYSPSEEPGYSFEGTVKWFNPARGIGFVVHERDGKTVDAALFRALLKESGYQRIFEGARISGVAAYNDRGCYVEKIVSVDQPSEGSDERFVYGIPDVTDGLERAEVKWVNYKNGFGFLKRQSGEEEIFLHLNELRRHGLVGVSVGQSVMVRVERTANGLHATEVYLDMAGRG